MAKYHSYRLYLFLTAFVMAVSSVLWVWMIAMMHGSLISWGYVVAGIIESTLLLPAIVAWLLWLYMVLVTQWSLEHPILLRVANRGLYLWFPLVITVGKYLGYSSDRISQSLIDLINHLVDKQKYIVEPNRLLLLTPHCIQNHDCVHKVTTDVHNCKRCGRCQVQDLLEVADSYGCHFIVVTGGTLARLMIKKIRPQAIVAIACERDLVSGMADVFPIPVIGVLNERPNGPCCNTKVDVDHIRKVVERLLNGHPRRER